MLSNNGRCQNTMTLAKVLSYCTVGAGTLYKLPQMVKIWRAGSARGIALNGVLLDTWCCAVEVAYSWAQAMPFLDWGEALPQMSCSAAVALQILYYERKARLPSLTVLGAAVVVQQATLMHLPRLFGRQVGLGMLSALKALNMAIMLLSKMPQICMNHRAKSTGELSLSTVAIGCLGSVVRFYTLAKSTNGADALMVANQGTSLALNSTILMQILMYNKSKSKKM
jgi:mannose-P-dolichol utilization defect protein 1